MADKKITDLPVVTSAGITPGTDVMPLVTAGDVITKKATVLDIVSAVISSVVTGVASVNTRTGVVTLSKSDVGLSNADNTSDANKPVSTATNTALTAGLATKEPTQTFASQAEMEAGSVTAIRSVSPLRVAQAIAALAPANSSSLKLLATITPTASANVDFLTTFTSSYDAYKIVAEGVKPATDDTLLLRFANAGVVDTGSHYFKMLIDASTTTAATSQMCGSTVTSAGIGSNLEVSILNANDPTNLKSIQGFCTRQSAATPGYSGDSIFAVYSAASTISGCRLYWSGGANFAATGKIYVYGYSNT